MRRAKRDMTQRAHKHGYTQGLRGHSRETCPHSDSERRGQWMGGWRIGHAEYVAGYRHLDFD